MCLSDNRRSLRGHVVQAPHHNRLIAITASFFGLISISIAVLLSVMTAKGLVGVEAKSVANRLLIASILVEDVLVVAGAVASYKLKLYRALTYYPYVCGIVISLSETNLSIFAREVDAPNGRYLTGILLSIVALVIRSWFHILLIQIETIGITGLMSGILVHCCVDALFITLFPSNITSIYGAVEWESLSLAGCALLLCIFRRLERTRNVRPPTS